MTLLRTTSAQVAAMPLEAAEVPLP
jgi:hypothetical protein